MRIGELASRAQVNPKTVRYYESLGLLPEPPRDMNGYRCYTEQDVQRLTFIKSAQRLGFTLDEVAELFSLHVAHGQPCDYVRERLQAHLSSVAERIQELRQLEDQLGKALATADHAPPEDGHLCCIIERAP